MMSISPERKIAIVLGGRLEGLITLSDLFKIINIDS
jgi:hypothetical protein